ncbi:hypothetical protein AB0O34_07960 [Sphaerisporangium sp. NPDC088356]|uniref:hypothetical protein n=1 Tax=Sphaerisporangium sp. NPDC088356 TaxID=3154871 RepID=UPI0034401C78
MLAVNLLLGAGVLAEFGGDPERYAWAKVRKSYAGTSPITQGLGKEKVVARVCGMSHVFAVFRHEDQLDLHGGNRVSSTRCSGSVVTDRMLWIMCSSNP